jgi:hypothetical protein
LVRFGWWVRMRVTVTQSVPILFQPTPSFSVHDFPKSVGVPLLASGLQFMSSPMIYTALNVPTATSYPSINCLQWSADGQACFITKTGAYIMVSSQRRSTHRSYISFIRLRNMESILTRLPSCDQSRKRMGVIVLCLLGGLEQSFNSTRRM